MALMFHKLVNIRPTDDSFDGEQVLIIENRILLLYGNCKCADVYSNTESKHFSWQIMPTLNSLPAQGFNVGFYQPVPAPSRFFLRPIAKPAPRPSRSSFWFCEYEMTFLTFFQQNFSTRLWPSQVLPLLSQLRGLKHGINITYYICLIEK